MIKHIEYLVKPFQDSKDLPINGCEGIVRNPFIKVLEEISRKGITAKEYLQNMQRLWEKRIDYVESNLGSLFVMIDIFWEDSRRPNELLELREYARHELQEIFVSLNSGHNTAEYLNKQVDLNSNFKIHAYGEISDRCAIGETNELFRDLYSLRPHMSISFDFDNKLCPDTLDGKFN